MNITKKKLFYVSLFIIVIIRSLVSSFCLLMKEELNKIKGEQKTLFFCRLQAAHEEITKYLKKSREKNENLCSL